ncbi:MAG: fumarylacetoacetate hydrolase family protein [Gammaproteobacteria bacterium]|nr:fumarylacetoacetate hydrolase family protein [Gammaproteobacteria bacterium]MDH3466426.1 fumarylacetoacetate hydrolase family protein [Gammaproteobacteria bacterium]
MTSYRILTYRSKTGPRGGVLVDDTVYDLQALSGQYMTTKELFEDWANASPIVKESVSNLYSTPIESVGKLRDVKLLAPILYPRAVFCVTANYVDHAREMGGEPADKSAADPFFFTKAPEHTIIGPGDPIVLPHWCNFLDWEAELAAVIGMRCRDVSAESALDYVAGYTILHDLSARDRFRRDDWPRWPMDWFGHKNFDGSAPLGPWVTPASEVPDPQDLAIQLWVNDEVQQDSSTSQMIFNISEQIEYLSQQITLLPGDVIATGTPAGVGMPRGRSLKPGDSVRIEIEGLGYLKNDVVQGTQGMSPE